MGFIDSLNRGEFVKICEIITPKGTDMSALYNTAQNLKGRADAFLVTDMPNAVMSMGSLAASCLLKQKGFEPIYNISCRDRNLLAIQSDLLSASALGLENIYITDGDDITLGDHPGSTPVNEINSAKLISLAKRLQEGYDSSGSELAGRPKFHVGAYVNSNAKVHALDLEIDQMEDKIKQEVAYFITPAIFDLKPFEEFMGRVRKRYKVPIIAEVILLKSVATAKFINKHIDNVRVPDEIIDRMQAAGDKLAESISITAEIIKGLRDICDGIYVVSLGWESKIPAYFDEAKI